MRRQTGRAGLHGDGPGRAGPLLKSLITGLAGPGRHRDMPERAGPEKNGPCSALTHVLADQVIGYVFL